MSGAEVGVDPPDGYVQVGWYCPGGHVVEHGIAGRSLRFDDPCTFGVPVYVLDAEVASPMGNLT